MCANKFYSCNNFYTLEELITGKSFTKALIPVSTNPQYDKDCSLIYQFNT